MFESVDAQTHGRAHKWTHGQTPARVPYDELPRAFGSGELINVLFYGKNAFDNTINSSLFRAVRDYIKSTKTF